MKPIDQYRFAKVLAVLAHPDDELFCGGLLRKLSQQDCEIGFVVCTSVAQANAAPILTDDRERQKRRLIAFGAACGMITAPKTPRTWALEFPNCREPSDDVQRAMSNRLLDVVGKFAPAVVVTHGQEGEYGHPQHRVVHAAAWAACQGKPVWTFSADGPLIVPVDLAWKRRLLDCYRYGTTQDAHWSPYYREAGASIEPWLGDKEGFQCVS